MLIPIWAVALVMLLMFFCGTAARHALTLHLNGDDGTGGFMGALFDLALAVIVLLVAA